MMSIEKRLIYYIIISFEFETGQDEKKSLSITRHCLIFDSLRT